MTCKYLNFLWCFTEDELERVGQEIVEDTPAYVREEMRVKFYKFHDNRRPPYYGTFRKKSTVVSGRKPFGQDKVRLFLLLTKSNAANVGKELKPKMVS